MPLACLLALLVAGPLAGSTVEVRVPDTPWVVALELPGWKGGVETKYVRLNPEDVCLLSGELQPGNTLVHLHSLPFNFWEAHRLRRLEPEYQPGGNFDLEGFHCVDRSLRFDGVEVADLDAYVATADQHFELRLLRPTKPLQRSELERMLKSVRVLLLRHGKIDDYPQGLAEEMTSRALAGEAQAAWKKRVLPMRAHPWLAAFVEAEFAAYEKQAPARQAELYTVALIALAAEEQPTEKLRFAWAMAEEGFGLAELQDGQPAKALPAFEHGEALLAQTQREESQDLAFALARAQALTGNEAAALASLARAIAGNARWRARAAQEPDFGSLQKLAAFQELVRKPPAAPGK